MRVSKHLKNALSRKDWITVGFHMLGFIL